jgi:hypothetical protein
MLVGLLWLTANDLGVGDSSEEDRKRHVEWAYINATLVAALSAYIAFRFDNAPQYHNGCSTASPRWSCLMPGNMAPCVGSPSYLIVQMLADPRTAGTGSGLQPPRAPHVKG